MKLSDTNQLEEFIRYSPYGVPTSFPRGDYDLDGDVDSADTTALGNFISGGSYGWNLDFNGDGNTDTGDTDDHAAYVSGYAQGLGGRTVLSRSGVRNRAGYAGYEFEPALPNSAWHVRHRVLVSELGRWNRRDPLGYVDGSGIEQYVKSNPLLRLDPLGLSGGGPGGPCSMQPVLILAYPGTDAWSGELARVAVMRNPRLEWIGSFFSLADLYVNDRDFVVLKNFRATDTRLYSSISALIQNPNDNAVSAVATSYVDVAIRCNGEQPFALQVGGVFSSSDWYGLGSAGIQTALEWTSTYPPIVAGSSPLLLVQSNGSAVHGARIAIDVSPSSPGWFGATASISGLFGRTWSGPLQGHSWVCRCISAISDPENMHETN